MERVAAILIAAHVLGDFVFQPDLIARNKRQPLFLLLHAAIHGLLAWLLLQSWQCWKAPVFVMIAHAAIDMLKQRYPRESLNAFIADQAAHILCLLILAWYLVRNSILPGFTGTGYQAIIEVAGFAIVVRGSGFSVSYVSGKLLRENGLNFDGLLNGGKLIGYFERALIFLFFVIGHPAGIGFLVAAKSILRFEEAKEQKQAEYILIGTLLSFSIAIALSSLTLYAIKL
jgi:hypothetical protein